MKPKDIKTEFLGEFEPEGFSICMFLLIQLTCLTTRLYMISHSTLEHNHNTKVHIYLEYVQCACKCQQFRTPYMSSAHLSVS